MGNYNYQIVSWPAQPRSKKRREVNIAAGGGSAFSGGGGGMADVDLSGYIRVADLIKTTSEVSASDFLDTNALSSLMVKSLLDQKANTIHDHASQLIRPAVMVVPQEDPSDAGFSLSSGEIAEFISHEGSFAEEASSVTPADLKDLVLKINGVTKTTYNPASAASFNVDLTSYATQSWVEAKSYLQGITKAMVEAVLTGNITSHTHSQYLTAHQSLTGYATQSWVEAKNYLQGITKAMVEAVLTGNITSHTHSQYLTSHQSLSGYATQTWVQQQGYLTSHQSLANYYTKTQADAKFLTEHQSLENYALKSEIPTSMAWTSITGRPTKLSDLTNDIISSWALAVSKPSYSWSEIGSRPTKLSQFTNDIISSWALASAKPSYTFSEIGSKPTTIDGYGITSVPEAYLTWGGKNFSASYGPVDAAMVSELGSNRFAFGATSAIEVYYSRDNGVTWLDYGTTDALKTRLVSGLTAAYTIGKASSNDVA